MDKILWRPTEEQIKDSNMYQFILYVNKRYNLNIHKYSELHYWSIKHRDKFWISIIEFFNVIFSNNWDKVIENPNKTMFGTKWFVGANLNFAENLLRHRNDNIALISVNEIHKRIEITYNQLYSFVASFAYSLRELGVKSGDRVAGFVSNTIEPVIAMLACSSIGAIWSSCSPDFGIKGVLDRFEQIQPKILIAVEEYSYGGKKFDCREKISEIVSSIKSIEKVILIPFNNDVMESVSVGVSVSIENKYFNDYLDKQNAELVFEQLPFDHPLYIMYSSGTTGKPKCIVHGQGGTLLQHLKELGLHTDLKKEDVITYYTTCGWMMWNWLISSLAIGSTVLLYDGNPAFPLADTLWKLAEKENVTIFGTSPKFLTFCEKTELDIKKKFRLNNLKVILSTGSTLSEENFNYVYEKIKSDVRLSSISGGTDIISCFMLGNPMLPVFEGEIQSIGLGMDVQVFNEKSIPVIDEKGELVCVQAFPSRPIYFWNDESNQKYYNSYFNFFPGIWRHGDFIKITKNGGIVVYGRSDATLNPGGVRIGTAEIYNVVENIDYIVDSLVVGLNINNDVEIYLFVALRDGKMLNKKIESEIKNTIRKLTTPRHVPSKIIQVNEIPRTISGKKVELTVTRILNREEIDNKDALANPQSLDEFYAIAKNILTNN